MAVLADLTESERYLLAILQDQSGIDIAEMTWTDSTSPDDIFRCYDFQYPWYRTRAKQQIDQCVASGSLVLTRRGQVPIEEVEIGDEVWTHRGRWRKVTYTYDQGERDVVEVVIDGEAALRATPDHRAFVRGEIFLPLEEIDSVLLDDGTGSRDRAPFELRPAGRAGVWDLEVEEDHSFLAGGIIVSNCARAIGKALALDTLVPTPTGWTTMGDLRAGDVVYDDQGQPTTVLIAYEVSTGRPCYEVVFDDGSTIVADEEHLWTTWDKRARASGHGRRIPRGAEVRTTAQIRDTLMAGKERNHSIDVAAPLEGVETDLPVDPYLLGYWLGDGSSRNSQITIGEQDREEVVRLLEGCGVTMRPLPSASTQFSTQWPHEHNRKTESVSAVLRSMGLLQNKHVPQDYLRAPLEQRIALIQGLMDSDGHVTPIGRCEITFKSEQLIEGVHELLASLGQKPFIEKRTAYCNGVDAGPVYRVGWTPRLGLIPFRLERKATRVRPARHDRVVGQRRIVDVRPVPSVPVRCITVDSPDSLFLVGRAMIPTHNSMGIQMRAFAFPFTNPGEEMLITAPELIHLDPVTKYIESRIMGSRIGREFLKTSGKATGFTHRPFETTFRNGASIKGRIPQKDGKGVKGSSVGTMLASTPNGLIRIDKLSVGDHVLTHEGRYMPILAIHGYEAETYLVAGAGHKGVQVSHNHRFYGRRNSNPQRTRNLGRPTWAIVDDEELAQRWYWATPTDFPALELPELPGDVQAPRPFAWLIGRYLADGNLNFEGGAGVGTPRGVYFTDDVAGIDEVRAMARLAGFDPKDREHDNASCVAIHRTELARFLLAHFGHRAEGKVVPAWVLGMARPLREDLLQGYLGGDGHWDEEKGRWEAGSASKELAMSIKLLAQSLGYTCGFSWVDPKPNRFCANPQRSYRVTISTKDRAILDGHLSWQKIRKVEPAGAAMVYDLVVAEDYSYVADGLVHKGSRVLIEEAF